MKIAIVSAFYSEGMGYSENCLSRALAKLGHEVHVIASTYNVYANEPLYDITYREFLGPREMPAGTRLIDGYELHRLPGSLFSGYVRFDGLNSELRKLRPDIVHSLEIASLQTFEIAALKPFGGFKLFTETHQTMSVMRPYMRDPNGDRLKRAEYHLTRTLPTYLSSFAVEACYAVTPDCGEVARRFYGVPAAKVKLLSLGADTDTFHPVEAATDVDHRAETRAQLGYSEADIVCVYTGRFTNDKNPVVLAKAIDALADIEPRYKGLFIGDGAQRGEIAACRHVTVRPFMSHARLAEHYRAADVGVWPRQESMSMIDAAASGVPIIVSNQIGEPSRAEGNGKMYAENDVASLVETLLSFADRSERRRYGAVGRQKVLSGFSWNSFARTVEADFAAALAR